MRTLMVTFELSTGSVKRIVSDYESQRQLLELLHNEDNWFGTGNEKVNLDYVTSYEIQDVTTSPRETMTDEEFKKWL
ncbi:hypothetical protein MOC27_18450 [Bacillus inaquosorum]|uniref:hypothetical protein n=1 Tax=Bacillus inaquosorum TaxID=483913 RepID=UPI0022822C52|nr:hypothetical protein [Bacillus inaquosorum]MCY8251684.1 hypothetical protein [Bacillus inaquosorum]